ncbi:MAG: element excision factor XisI family protein [Caldilineaceae bacterium]
MLFRFDLSIDLGLNRWHNKSTAIFSIDRPTANACKRLFNGSSRTTAKILIQHNATDVDIAEELVDAGVSKDQIVLAMHPASLREYTGYAVA